MYAHYAGDDRPGMNTYSNFKIRFFSLFALLDEFIHKLTDSMCTCYIYGMRVIWFWSPPAAM